MNINDHKLLRKMLDDLGRKYAYDRIDYWSMQLDSGMVAEVRFVEPATLPEIVNASPDVACCAHEIGDVVCASACGCDDDCPHDDGRCCEVCAHYNGGKLTETCYHCSMLSHWQEGELTDDEIDALMDDDIMPVRCATCKHMYKFGMDCPDDCHEGNGDAMWEPKD